MNLQRIAVEQALSPRPELAASQVDCLATLLSRAFHNEPNLEYMFPDGEARRVVSHSFFLSAIRAGERYGEIHTTENLDAIAVWIRPENNLPFRRMVQGLMAYPLNHGRESAARYLKLFATIDEVRRHLVPTPHWYLLVLGQETSQSEETIGEALIEPVLLRADSTGVPCYLETFSEKRLAFYKELGFRIAGAGRIPDDGPNFWAMTRDGSRRCINDTVRS